MPLTAVDFVPKGPVKSADILQFYNLFTGVMVDQPVTFSNVLNVGGSQGNTTVPLKLYGAAGQTGHLIDLYADRTQAQPGFGFGADGAFGWGPGGAAPIDTTLSRIGTQGHPSDTPGLRITPALDVSGGIRVGGSITFPSGAALQDGSGGIVAAVPHFEVQGNLYVGLDHTSYFHQVRAGEIGVLNRFMVNGADAEAAGLTFANAMLETRGADLNISTVGGYSIPFSAYAFASNWIQFNPKFYVVTAGAGWPGIALLLDYDVDNNSPAGGRISMMNGRIALGGLVNGSAETIQLLGATRIQSSLHVTSTITGDDLINSAGRIFSGTDIMAGNGSIYLGGQSDTLLQRQSAGVISTPGAISVALDALIGRNMNVAGTLSVATLLATNLTVSGNLTLEGAPGSQAINLPNSTGIGWANGAGTNAFVLGFDNSNQIVLGVAGGQAPAVTVTASAGAVGVPGACWGFLNVNMGGAIKKIPLYNP